MWRCVHFRREVRPDAVRFYAPWAFAGTHTLSYDAIAATRGEFGLPPALAAAALEPETMGLSAGGGISVQVFFIFLFFIILQVTYFDLLSFTYIMYDLSLVQDTFIILLY